MKYASQNGRRISRESIAIKVRWPLATKPRKILTKPWKNSTVPRQLPARQQKSRVQRFQPLSRKFSEKLLTICVWSIRGRGHNLWSLTRQFSGAGSFSTWKALVSIPGSTSCKGQRTRLKVQVEPAKRYTRVVVANWRPATWMAEAVDGQPLMSWN